MRRNSWMWVFSEDFTQYLFTNRMTGRTTARTNAEYNPKAATELCNYLNSRG